jgi:arylsulfatase
VRGDGHDPARPPGSAGTFLALGPGWSTAANTPFRYHKSWVHEGGIATPCIVHWPAGIAAHGELRSAPGHVIDIPPTVLEIAGAKMQAAPNAPPIAGRSLVPAFAKDAVLDRDALWWCHDGNRAIRVGDWKLVADHDKPWELYNLANDRSETRDLADKHPDKVRELENAWQKRAESFRTTP